MAETGDNRVFFMIGCQRSGSNWLRTMLGEREDLIAPHPPHILREFLPIYSKFGDVEDIEKLKILVDHVCTFVEKNQVTWLDRHGRPIKFDRVTILKNTVTTIDCLRSVTKMTRNVDDATEIIDQRYYLIAIFDEIYSTCAEVNGCKYWMCKSMGMSQYYDMLVNFYGKERLRFIYLVRDPRDVTLSFTKTPVGDCHPYVISEKWRKLQNHALRVLSDAPELVHQVRYENILTDKVLEVSKINEFMGTRGICRTLRRGSVVVLADDQELSNRAKCGREATNAKDLSYQFKNLTRGESLAKKQFAKYLKDMEEEDVTIVESVCFEEMSRLGYFPHVVKKEEDRIVFTEEKIAEYKKLNEELINKMNEDLAVENPDDLNRRRVQAAVLKARQSYHFRQTFANLVIDREGILDDTDDEDNIVKTKFDTSDVKFHQWPKRASNCGFLSRGSVIRRLIVDPTQTISLSDNLEVTFASGSQRGYYPSDHEKANQDSYLSGVTSGGNGNHALFSVFDGHGTYGDICAQRTRDVVQKEFTSKIKKIAKKVMKKKSEKKRDEKEAASVQELFKDAYLRANENLKNDKKGIGEASGTTAVSLCVGSNGNLYTSNVGDSRCLLIYNTQGPVKFHTLTTDHSPDRPDEKIRIEKCGGKVMTSDQYDANDTNLISYEPYRVWSKEGKWPGTAFSRSIGDANAEDLGVVADPEFCEMKLPDDDTIFVVGSDGIFDFLNNEIVAEIANQHSDPGNACRCLIGNAYHKWNEKEERTDDITVIVGRIKRTEPVAQPVGMPRSSILMRSILGKSRVAQE